MNTYSLNNVGDAAIYAGLIKLAHSQGLNNFQFPKLMNAKADISRNLGTAFESFESKKCPSYLAVGGDIFNNARPQFVTKQFLSNIQDLSKDPKSTVLFGQSIPRSCRGLSFKYLSYRLKKLSNVFVRDFESFHRLKQQGVNVKLSFDSAFAAPIDLNHHHIIADINEYSFDKLVLISLRCFGELYPQNNQIFTQELIQLVKKLRSLGLIPAIILQSDVNENDSDKKVIEEINQYVSVVTIDPFLIHRKIPNIAPWQITQALIAQAKIVIGVRYHTSIFRLMAGKMPFNLYYSNKGEDLSKRLNVPGAAIEDFSVEEHFQSILNSANQHFDVDVIAKQVTTDFKQAIAKIH